ncbi:deoxyribonuclease IV [Methanogenium organophilum]|uniref:Probable endonuclease 4 n=1 Tax=Methanogenium organophilum TaxID=2199 RepID=A0A9X9S5A4_METOG|nr:deoxyribonuclease IV [Methanogenium organophilum]WAI01982.1 deoxyribonuclease IV [Methanogenium organophilum]
MINIGCHVSIAGSLAQAITRAEERTCTTCQIFIRNPRGWKVKPLTEEDAAAFREAVQKSGITPVVAHMPYLPNPASPREEVWEKSVAAIATEVERCRMLGIPYLVTHLGSSLGSPLDEARERAITAIGKGVDASNGEVMILLENTAGTKNSIGTTFEEIAMIMEGVGRHGPVGICFDTCHAFAAGYDLRTPEATDAVVRNFDTAIGLSHLKVIHLNDTISELGGRRDRHEHIGIGNIGREGIRSVVSHPALRDLPFICETPVDERRDDRGNIACVRKIAGE